MATHAEAGDAPLPLNARELQTRKAFVGVDVAATRALQALRPWMEAHVQEVVEEFYAHLLRFEQPRWLLADPQRLAQVKAAQIDSFLSFTAGHFDMAYVAMFDEVDEATAIFKVSNTPPTQAKFATYDGLPADAKPFTRKEVLPLLERWFFNR